MIEFQKRNKTILFEINQKKKICEKKKSIFPKKKKIFLDIKNEIE